MNLAALAAILPAAFGLEEVTLLINAIRTADISSAANLDPLTLRPAAEYAPREHIHLPAEIEPRPVYTAGPRITPSRLCVIDQPKPLRTHTDDVQTCCPPAPCEPATAKPPRVQPPWRVLPWHDTKPPAIRVKVVYREPDKHCKGSLVDIFL